MKKLLSLVLVVFLPACNSLDRLMNGKPAPGALVIVTFGQSNSVSPANTATPRYSYTGRVHILDETAGDTAFHVPGKNTPMITSITWLIMGDALVATLDRDIYILNVGVGGESTKWLLENRLEELRSKCAQYAPTIGIWIQGESEGAHYDETYGNMQKLLSVSPGTQWYVALDGWGQEPDKIELSATRRAQRAIIGNGLAMQGVDVDQMRYDNLNWFTIRAAYTYGAEVDTDAGHEEHAKRWLKVLKIG